MMQDDALSYLNPFVDVTMESNILLILAKIESFCTMPLNKIYNDRCTALKTPALNSPCNYLRQPKLKYTTRV